MRRLPTFFLGLQARASASTLWRDCRQNLFVGTAVNTGQVCSDKGDGGDVSDVGKSSFVLASITFITSITYITLKREDSRSAVCDQNRKRVVRAGYPKVNGVMRHVPPAGLLLLIVTAGCAGIPDRPPRLSRSSYGCMQAVVREKVPEDLPEKRAHCMASGLIARYCSIPEAYLAGSAKELRDLLSAGDAQWSDWQADRAGIDCARSANDDSALVACCADRGY